MDFKEYEQRARVFARYPNPGNNLPYSALGLCGESGEIAEKVKKIIRDDNGEVTDLKREALTQELGDVLWYLQDLAWALGTDLETIARRNIGKLEGRSVRGTLHGSGDDR